MKKSDPVFYDISMAITRSMPVYKGKEEKRPIISVDGDYTTGTAYESRIEMNLHTGTHVDSPLHMLPDGTTVDTLDLEKLITVCTVIDLTQVEEKIKEEDLAKKKISEDSFILLKTKNSYQDILENQFVYLEKSGASYLRQKKITGVGIDALGIERNQPEHETHKQLFEDGIIILEGLRLKEIEEGEYLLLAAPILIPGAEAAPVRAVLISNWMKQLEK